MRSQWNVLGFFKRFLHIFVLHRHKWMFFKSCSCTSCVLVAHFLGQKNLMCTTDDDLERWYNINVYSCMYILFHYILLGRFVERHLEASMQRRFSILYKNSLQNLSNIEKDKVWATRGGKGRGWERKNTNFYTVQIILCFIIRGMSLISASIKLYCYDRAFF